MRLFFPKKPFLFTSGNLIIRSNVVQSGQSFLTLVIVQVSRDYGFYQVIGEFSVSDNLFFTRGLLVGS